MSLRGYLRQKIADFKFYEVVGEVVIVLGLLFIFGGIYLWSITEEARWREGAFVIALGLMMALAGVGISAECERKKSRAYKVYAAGFKSQLSEDLTASNCLPFFHACYSLKILCTCQKLNQEN